MTAFLIGAALLLAVSLALVLLPLLRKEQAASNVQRDQLNLAVLRDQLRELEADLTAGTIDATGYESARQELERRVAEEVLPAVGAQTTAANKRWTAIAVAVAVPLLAGAVYMTVGAPQALDPAAVQSAADQENAHSVTPEQIEGMIAKLAERMQQDPDNPEGWSMLARSYNAVGKYDKASEAYARLVKLVPDDAGLLADYADTLAMAMNRSLLGEPEKLVERAVAIDPKNVKALALWGSAAFERKDYAAAADRWQKILAFVPPDSDIARSITGSISEAQSMMGKRPATVAKQDAPKAAAAGGAKVSGTVELDPSLRAQVADTDTVFIFARAAQGPRFPLAVLRKQVKDLPASFELDDSMAMTPEAKLSSVPMVVVGARISKTGSATPTPGDLEGLIEPVAPGASNLKIRINKRNG